MRTVFHILSASDWERAQVVGEWRAETLLTEGFIHMSRPEQVLGVAERYFKGRENLVLLQIAEESLVSRVKYEGGAGEKFPHLYGPMNLNAVVAVHSFDGRRLPKDLQMVDTTLIRQGLPGDEAEIASAHTHAWQQSYPGLMPESFLASRPLEFRRRLLWWRDMVQGRTPAKVFVAESQAHGVVAFVAAEPARDEDFSGWGEIAAIYALEGYKGKGLGAALFQRARDWLKGQGFNSHYLWVLRGNPAEQFYRRMGGEPLEKTKFIDLGGARLEEFCYVWDGLKSR